MKFGKKNESYVHSGRKIMQPVVENECLKIPYTCNKKIPLFIKRDLYFIILISEINNPYHPYLVHHVHEALLS